MRLLCVIILMCSVLGAWAQPKPYHGDGPDDVLRFVPLASAVALKACGVESQSSWGRLAVNGGLSIALTCATTWSLKAIVHDTRPDGTDDHAFPSGHTSFAFAGARILDKEYRHVSPWISVAGYTVAIATAADRVARNRHHFEDVAAGAVIGLAAAEVGYWLGNKIFRPKNTDVAVSIAPNGLCVALVF